MHPDQTAAAAVPNTPPTLAGGGLPNVRKNRAGMGKFPPHGVSVWSKDLCYHGFGQQFVEAISVRFFARALVSFVFFNLEDSITEITEQLVTNVQFVDPETSSGDGTEVGEDEDGVGHLEDGAPADEGITSGNEDHGRVPVESGRTSKSKPSLVAYIKVDKALQPGDCIGWHFHPLPPGLFDEKSRGSEASAAEVLETGDVESGTIEEGGTTMTPYTASAAAWSSSTSRIKNDTILSTSIPSLVATTGSCETVNEVTHFYYTDAGLNKRRASELAPKRLFVAENCLDVAVRHYRIAPRMKWCDESGKELFTSSQKRIWTRGLV